MWDLVPPPRIEPRPPLHWEHEVLATGLLGKSNHPFHDYSPMWVLVLWLLSEVGWRGGSETKRGMFPAQEIHCGLSVRCVFDFLESINILLGSYDVFVTQMTGPRIT